MEDNPRPFLEHLEELRSRLIKSLLAIALATAAVFPFVDRILHWMARPIGHFIFLGPTEAFFVRLKIALGAGAILAAPVILFQAWRFVALALTSGEKRQFLWILPSSYFLFGCGFSFGFWVLVPLGVKFLLGYGSEVLVPQISIEQYLNFLATLCLSLGLLFQMPLASFFLARMGILDSAWLAEKRRIAVLVIYIASALLTPGPDPVTAILLAAPTYLLFELSIFTARWARPPE